MCGILGLTGVSCEDIRKREKKLRMSDEEYKRYLKYYEFEDSEHNYKGFVIWKGFGSSI